MFGWFSPVCKQMQIPDVLAYFIVIIGHIRVSGLSELLIAPKEKWVNSSITEFHLSFITEFMGPAVYFIAYIKY